MIKKESRNEMRKVRHERIRKQIIGTKDIPRLNVYRSTTNIYAQVINDEANRMDRIVEWKNKEGRHCRTRKRRDKEEKRWTLTNSRNYSCPITPSSIEWLSD